jgi:uncharacterized membrane protein
MDRLLRNLFGAWFRVPAWFPPATLARIRDAIAAGERTHAGEVVFAVEARYSPWAVLTGLQVRARAEQVFANLRVWDTRDNSGVLLYLQLAERRVELVADRGIATRVPAEQWQALCAQFAADIASGSAETAVLACIERLHGLLALHFPAEADNPDEYPDEPIIL